MKATGVVRKVDELGRIVLPIELRRNLDINIKDSLEIYVEGENIVLKKYHPCCISAVKQTTLFLLWAKTFAADASLLFKVSKFFKKRRLRSCVFLFVNI